jgi:hypothetical protein
VRINFLRPALMAAAIVTSAGILAGGLALRPAFAVGGTAIVGPFTITHCSKTTACKGFSNAGTGAGLQGTNTNAATSGAGLIGNATLGGTGVSGQSTNGLGVAGGSTTSIGVYGNSQQFFGVVGATQASNPVDAGVQGENNASTIAVRANGFGGPLFVGNGSGGIDVFTVDNAGNTAISGDAVISGISGTEALFAGSSAAYSGVTAIGGNIGVAGYGQGLSPYGVAAYNQGTASGAALGAQDYSGNGVIMDGFDSAGNLKLQIQDDGTVYAHNFVIAFDTPNHQKATAFATMSSTPSVEDFGEAQLTAGQAYVSLNRTFAAEIDSRSGYLVFITPEGDTRGLYATQKTPAGFVVRENQGGRSDAAFSYRIVAKQYGATTATLRPAVAPPLRLPTMPKFHRVPKTRS